MRTTGIVRRRVLTALAALAAAAALVFWGASAHAAPPATYTGTTSDGGSWVADLPANWNGTLLLYSHGFGPPQAADAPDASTKQALLDRGYALSGSKAFVLEDTLRRICLILSGVSKSSGTS